QPAAAHGNGDGVAAARLDFHHLPVAGCILENAKEIIAGAERWKKNSLSRFHCEAPPCCPAGGRADDGFSEIAEFQSHDPPRLASAVCIGTLAWLFAALMPAAPVLIMNRCW